MMKHIGTLSVFFILFISPTMAIGLLTGKVLDAQTGEPLAFVHILHKETNNGTLSDIDGNFSISILQYNGTVQVSYIGYATGTYDVSGNQHLEVTLHRYPFQLSEVMVVAGENPAHRIIRNVIKNKRENNPENLQSFNYTSYNKFIGTLDPEFYVERWQLTRDSANLRMVDILDDRHLFLMESVTERIYKKPRKNQETVVANRVSGLQNPIFTMLATELQPFSFYESNIALFEKNYVSPLNSATFGRYSFHLEDTILQGQDTTFVISFQPKNNFDGLKGALYINTYKWAIESVIAEPANEIISGLSFRIQQKYSLIDDQYWFPVQLNTFINFFNSDASDPSSRAPITMSGKSYIENIAINPEISMDHFGPYAVDFLPNANRISNEFWNSYRPESISRKEQNTYLHMDSLGRELNLEGVLNTLEPLAFGEIPVGYLNIPLNSIYKFNNVEKHRLGIGFTTNNRLSRRFVANAGYAWATGDRQEKYSFGMAVMLAKKHQITLGIQHSLNLTERGGNQLIIKNYLFNMSLIRSFYMDKMDYTQKNTAHLSFFSINNYLETELSVSQGKTWWSDIYYFSSSAGEPGLRNFDFFQLQLRMRLAWGESLMNTPLRTIRLPGKAPVFHINISKGLKTMGYESPEFLRIESRLDYSYTIPVLGEQTWIAEGGWVNNPGLPWPLLFTAKAGNRDFYLASPLSFGTMSMSEFVADRYIAIFFQHNFRGLFFSRPGYKPQPVIIVNAGFGELRDPSKHTLMSATTWDKGYIEAGFAIQKILPASWSRRIVFGLSPGIEVLYRMGHYAFDNPGKNLTIKLSMVPSF